MHNAVWSQGAGAWRGQTAGAPGTCLERRLRLGASAGACSAELPRTEHGWCISWEMPTGRLVFSGQFINFIAAPPVIGMAAFQRLDLPR